MVLMVDDIANYIASYSVSQARMSTWTSGTEETNKNTESIHVFTQPSYTQPHTQTTPFEMYTSTCPSRTLSPPHTLNDSRPCVCLGSVCAYCRAL